MNKTQLAISVALMAPLSVFEVWRGVEWVSERNPLVYACEAVDEPGYVTEVLTINGIRYEAVHSENDGNYYDKKYIVDGKTYKRDKLYAVTKTDTPCDDYPVYTLKGLSAEKYVVKLAHDYTGFYDGSLFKATD